LPRPREVVERAAQLTGLSGGTADLLGEAEVGQIGLALFVEQDVGGLDVAVDEPFGVGGFERLRRLSTDRERLLGRELALAGDQRLQVLAFDVAHRQVELALLLACLVDGQDVRVAERGGELRLPQKTLAEVLVRCQLGRDQFERHRPVEPELASPVEHADPTDAHDALDLVAGEA
jgi:hypothetical protein